MLDHSFTEEIPYEAPTYYASGIKAHLKCTRCTAISLDGIDECTASDLYLPALDYINKGTECPGRYSTHTMTNAPLVFVRTITPGCTNDGYDLYKCIECSRDVATNYIKASHKYDLTSPVATSAPSCTKYGFWFYGCGVCGIPGNASDDTGTTNAPIPSTAPAGSEWVSGGVLRLPKLAHKFTVYVPYKGAEGYESGNLAHYLCRICSAVSLDAVNECSVSDVTIPGAERPRCPGATAAHYMTNCTTVFVKTVAPQCGKFGYDLYECTTCRTPLVTNWTALGDGEHKWSDVEATPHSCETDGVLAHYKCDVCGVLSFDKERIVSASDVVDVARHEWDPTKTVITTSPTCTDEGIALDWCIYCGAYESHKVDATGHNYQWVIASSNDSFESYMCVAGNGSAGCGHVKDTREAEYDKPANWLPID